EQATAFIRAGQEATRAKRWEAALAVADRGLKVVDPPAVKELAEWRSNVCVQWADEERKQGAINRAADVLAKARDTNPKDRDLVSGVVYLAQESVKMLDESKGPAAAAAQLARLRERFPDVKD